MKNVKVMNEEYNTAWSHIEDIIILLTIIVVFILKLTGVITISWFWLLSVVWVPSVLLILFVLCSGIAGIILAIYDKIKEKKNERY